MKYNIPFFIFSLIIITGCSDEEENLSNTFHSTHAGSVWVTTNYYWYRINEDSEDDYWDNKCTRYPFADGTYNSSQDGVQYTQTLLRNESNFISYQIEFIGESSQPDGTFTMSVNSIGTKLTVTTTNNTDFIFTKVTDSFPGTDCLPN
tara:strand:- start:819 stop:1262 length:444 start_codon:yes stop_codon:yes gene_type:complete